MVIGDLSGGAGCNGVLHPAALVSIVGRQALLSEPVVSRDP
jgi:hypothetical protein